MYDCWALIPTSGQSGPRSKWQNATRTINLRANTRGRHWTQLSIGSHEPQHSEKWYACIHVLTGWLAGRAWFGYGLDWQCDMADCCMRVCRYHTPEWVCVCVTWIPSGGAWCAFLNEERCARMPRDTRDTYLRPSVMWYFGNWCNILQ